LIALLLYAFGEQWLRRILLYLSSAPWARTMVTGFPPARSVASRFVAGETIGEAIATARELDTKGMTVAMDFLGESVTEPSEAIAARDYILSMLDSVQGEALDTYSSIKLSQLGITLDEQLAIDNLRAILVRAQEYGMKVRIDMEDSKLVDATLRIYRLFRDEEGFDNLGVVIQAYLFRSEADVQRLIEEGAWVRLVKGAYLEAANVAFANKADTDANFVRLAQHLLSEEMCAHGGHVAIASHDEQMIQATIDFTKANNVPTACYEYQMLYGIRREMQEALVAQGYAVRIYVPYGTAWYPYFMRRLAERPANLWFFVSNFFRA